MGIVIYFGLVFLTEWSLLVLKLTGFVAIFAILGIGGWIGWTMATTPPPKPIEELEAEIERETSAEIKVKDEPEENKAEDNPQ